MSFVSVLVLLLGVMVEFVLAIDMSMAELAFEILNLLELAQQALSGSDGGQSAVVWGH